MGKKLLTTWLLGILNNDQIPGCSWLPETNRRKFQIIWKHGRGRGWLQRHGRIFKEYVESSGIFVVGHGHLEDYSRWKKLLRNALKKSKDFEYNEQLSKKGKYLVWNFMGSKYSITPALIVRKCIM